MIIIKRRNLNIAIISIFAALICGNAYAEHGHGGGHSHGGGNWNHGGGNWNHGGGVGFYFGAGPYYYPYSPYYYPYGNYIIVSPTPSTQSTKYVTQNSVTVMRAQVELVSLGYYNGSVDGILGPETKAAIIAFQHNKKLSETGKLDTTTLKALGVKK